MSEALEQDKTGQLAAFKYRYKFSDDAWHNRGLHPSSTELSLRLTQLFNDCADALITAITSNASDRQLKNVLKMHLSNFDKRDYDTEEREFICDLFYELAQILNIDFADNAARWLYGSKLVALQKLLAAIRPNKVLETKSQNCQNCGALLETFILRKEQGIPDHSWDIVQCKSCRDYSIISIGPNVKEVRFGNYIMIEQLPKEDFTREQAEIRLEQIRYFRK